MKTEILLNATEQYNSVEQILKLKSTLESLDLPESETIKLVAANVVSSGLVAIHNNLLALGARGKIKDTENQFKDMALKADVTSEDIWRQHIGALAEALNLRIRYRGEELGDGYLGPEAGTEWTAIWDGLDGSANYLDNKPWPYGTMIALAPGYNPTYNDFVVAGNALEGPDIFLTAVKGFGVIATNHKDKTNIRLPNFNQEETYDESKILADNTFDEAKKNLGKKSGVWLNTGSQAGSTGAIVLGNQQTIETTPPLSESWQALVDVTRKKNLEQPCTYLMVTELGGVMVTNGKESIGPKHFDAWAQSHKVLLVTARNNKIIEGIFEELELNQAL